MSDTLVSDIDFASPRVRAGEGFDRPEFRPKLEKGTAGLELKRPFRAWAGLVGRELGDLRKSPPPGFGGGIGLDVTLNKLGLL